MFSSIINEAGEKYGLGDKAGGLVSALLALMTDPQNGGFAGFLNRFRQVGLGDLADSWVASGANTPISYEQTESAFGDETLRSIADKAGVDYKTATTATAHIIPHLVDDLTPNGTVPDDGDLLSRIGGYLSGTGGAAVGTSAAANTLDRVDASVSSTTGDFAGGEAGDDNPVLAWLLPLLILGLLIIVGYSFCGGKSEPIAVPEANSNRTVENINASPPASH